MLVFNSVPFFRTEIFYVSLFPFTKDLKLLGLGLGLEGTGLGGRGHLSDMTLRYFYLR